MEMPNVAVPDTWKQFDGVGRRPVSPAAPLQGPLPRQQVIYVADDGRHLAADVLAILADGVELRVNDPRHSLGFFRASPIRHDASKSVGTWYYPEE